MWPHAYHQLGCGCDRHRIARHEALLCVVSATLADEGGYTWELKRYLGSSVYRRSKVDLLLTSLTADPPITALDITVSCPLLPSYVSACAASASRIISLRASEKIRHHLPGCLQLGRAFLPIVCTTVGAVGPRP